MEKEGRVEAGVLSRCHTMTEDRRCVGGGHRTEELRRENTQPVWAF